MFTTLEKKIIILISNLGRTFLRNAHIIHSNNVTISVQNLMYMYLVAILAAKFMKFPMTSALPKKWIPVVPAI